MLFYTIFDAVNLKVLTPFSMVLVWQMVPSAAGMLVVMQRLLLLMHQSSLQTSCVDNERRRNIIHNKHAKRTNKTLCRFYLRSVQRNTNKNTQSPSSVPSQRCLQHMGSCFIVYICWLYNMDNEFIKLPAVPDVRLLWSCPCKIWPCTKEDAILWKHSMMCCIRDL